MVELKWLVYVDEKQHEVVLRHHPFAGWLTIHVDGQEAYYRGSRLTGPGAVNTIKVGSELLPFKVERVGESFTYSLEQSGRPLEPVGWPLPPGPKVVSVSRQNIIRETITLGILTLVSILASILIGGVGLLVFGLLSLYWCYRVMDMMVMRIELNSLGIAQKSLFLHRYIPWQDVTAVLMDPDGQMSIKSQREKIDLKAQDFHDLRVLGWWVEYMAAGKTISTARFQEVKLLTYSRPLSIILLPLMVALGFQDYYLVLTGLFGGILAGFIWRHAMVKQLKKKVKSGGPPLASLLLTCFALMQGLIFRGSYSLAMVAGVVYGMIIFFAISKETWVQRLYAEKLEV